jgi:hypothetical protein
MPLEAYLPRGFEHAHENAAFELLVQSLRQSLGHSAARHVLIGNVMFSGSEMDAVLFKPDAICIIEMKDHGGPIQFSENGTWRADGREVKGGTKENPFIQVRGYRIALRNWLEDLEDQLELHPRPDGYWRDICAVILFARDIQFDERQLPNGLRPWFHITDMTRVAGRISGVRARNIQIREEEINSILERLGIEESQRFGLKPAGPGGPLEVTATPPSSLLKYSCQQDFLAIVSE